jgi:hypothetical protein
VISGLHSKSLLNLDVDFNHRATLGLQYDYLIIVHWPQWVVECSWIETADSTSCYYLKSNHLNELI